MKYWKLTAIGWGIVSVAFFSGALLRRPSNGVLANDLADPQSSLNLAVLPSPETATVPAGTRMDIRLQDTISSEKSSPGDRFTASLRGPLIADAQLLAPSRCKLIGQIIQVERSDGVEGSSKLTVVLEKLTVNGKEYNLETQPLTLVARSTKTKDAAGIGRRRAAGKTIGAITGKAKSAAIGAGFTEERPVSYGPETRFTFTLSRPLELPVIRKMGSGKAEYAVRK